MNRDCRTFVRRCSQTRTRYGAWLWIVMAAWLPCVSAESVSRLEYDIDDDPGEGNGISLEIEGEAAEFDVPTLGLAPGLHFLTVRALEEREGEEHSAIGTRAFGVDLGSLGGVSPYVVSGIPPLPFVEEFQAQAVVGPEGPLRLKFKVLGGE